MTPLFAIFRDFWCHLISDSRSKTTTAPTDRSENRHTYARASSSWRLARCLQSRFAYRKHRASRPIIGIGEDNPYRSKSTVQCPATRTCIPRQHISPPMRTARADCTIPAACEPFAFCGFCLHLAGFGDIIFQNVDEQYILAFQNVDERYIFAF